MLFLGTDVEYEKDRQRPRRRLSLWQKLLLAPALVIGVVIAAAVFSEVALTANDLMHTDGGAGPLVCILALTGVCLVVGTAAGIRATRFWPFRRASDYRRALSDPKLLCGKRR